MILSMKDTLDLQTVEDNVWLNGSWIHKPLADQGFPITGSWHAQERHESDRSTRGALGEAARKVDRNQN